MNRIGDSLFCTGSNEEIVRAFSECAVEFVVIGGLAVAWYCSNRQANDMDLLINPSPKNSAWICQALGRLHLTGYTNDSFSELGLQVPLKKMHYAELLTPRIEGPTFAAVANDAVKGKLFNFPVLIATAASLILLKELAVASSEEAEKHLSDIECLRAYGI